MPLNEAIANVFADAQKSSINHRSLTKRLCKIEAKAPDCRSQFEEQIIQSTLRCLEVSKADRAGLNIVKFLCTYCAVVEGQEQENEEEEESSKITSQIMVALLPYMSVKDKVIRYRATQIVSQLMGIVQEIEDEVYQAIRHELTKRVRDKVPAIRLEAVCALGRLLENEMDEEAQAANGRDDDDDQEMLDDDDEERDSTGLLDKLLEVLQNDTNADVRKALLLNLPIEAKTLPYLLERARDKDASVRRSLYAKLIPNLGDFRHMSLSMREKLLRWGLRDRDERVRKAAAKMFCTLWIEQIAKLQQQTDADAEEEQPKKRHAGFYDPTLEALTELLERIDILNCGDDRGVGPEAMREFWSLRPDYFDAMFFDEDFFINLTTESSFIARSFYDYCSHNTDAQRKAEDDQKFPEVTRFGFHLQKHLNRSLEVRSGNTTDEIDEQALTEQDFISEQLLHIAHNLDYTDEIGRRKMFGLLRQMLSMPDLPEEITKLAIEALRLTCTSDTAGEKEFIAVVMEAIVDVQDALNDNEEPEDEANRQGSPADDESFVSARSEVSRRSDHTARPQPTKMSKKLQRMTPEEREEYEYQTVVIQLKCLNIAHTLLQNITSDFSANVNLETMLNTLIIPAVRSTDAPLRERAVECMGLACLLSPKLADDNRGLFVYCMERARDHEQLRTQCLKILCDCIVTHNKSDNVDLAPFITAFEYSADIQFIATTCIAKLMMCGFYTPKLVTDSTQEPDEDEDESLNVFEQAIEEATQAGVKGWELLAKVKAALVADAQGKGQGDEGERRQS